MRAPSVVLLGFSLLAAPVRAQEVKDIPAVNSGRYPDSIGYLYEGALATIVWLQNSLPVTRVDELERRLRRNLGRGLSGEVVVNAMQDVEPIAVGQPTLRDMARRTVQAVRLLSQYTFVAHDYGDSLRGGLADYTADGDRLSAIAASAARAEAALSAAAQPHPPGTLPGGPPPSGQSVIKPGRYFSQAVLDGRQDHLRRRAHRLSAAIQSSDPIAYGAVFADVFFAQMDADLAVSAREALAVDHDSSVLRGQAFDAVLARTVFLAVNPGRPFSMEQLRLINQINLRANDQALPRPPLVAALLLVELDHRRDLPDAQVTAASIWQHVDDAEWLVAQYVRLKADGTTADQVFALVNSIIGGL